MRLIGVNQGPGGGDNYPILLPPSNIEGLIADMSLGFQYDIPSLELKITKINLSTGEFVITDLSGTVVFSGVSSGDTVETSYWGGSDEESSPYMVYSIDKSDATLSVIFRRDVLESLTRVTPVIIPRGDAVLDPRVIYCAPKHVRSVTIIDSNGESHVSRGKDIIFEPGYNMKLSLTPEDTSLRRVTALNINAEAGSGLGRVPCGEQSEESRVLKFFNGAAPEEDSGALYLEPDSGYSIERYEDELNKMHIYNVDRPCCSCEQQEDVRDYLNELAWIYAGLGDEAHRLKLRQTTNINIWNNLNIKFKVPGPVSLNNVQNAFRITVTPTDCRYVTVRVDAMNITQQIASMEVSMAFQASSDGTEYTSCKVSPISDIYTYQGTSSIFVDDVEQTVPAILSVPNTKLDWSEHANYDGSLTKYKIKWSGVRPGSAVSWTVLLRKKDPRTYFRVNALQDLYPISSTDLLYEMGCQIYRPTSSDSKLMILQERYAEVCRTECDTSLEAIDRTYDDEELRESLVEKIWEVRQNLPCTIGLEEET